MQAGYELRVADVVVHAVVHDGALDAGVGPLPDADLVIELPEITTLKPLLAGELGPAEAVRSGRARITGDLAEFERFVTVFGLAPSAAQPS